MQNIIPFLWFDGNAKQAVACYTGIFENSLTVHISRYGPGAPMPASTMMLAKFRLLGQEFYALNGGPAFQFSPAVSFFIRCEDQAEVDYYWERLTDGGTPQPCGWLRDRYGLSWQVIPNRLGELLEDADSKRAKRAIEAMLRMQKIEIALLEAAVDEI